MAEKKVEVLIAPRVEGFCSHFTSDTPTINWSLAGTVETGEAIPVAEMQKALKNLIGALDDIVNERQVMQRMQELQETFQGKVFSDMKNEGRRV